MMGYGPKQSLEIKNPGVWVHADPDPGGIRTAPREAAACY